MIEVSPLEISFSLEDFSSEGEKTVEKSFLVRNTGEEEIRAKIYTGGVAGLENSAFGRLKEWVEFGEEGEKGMEVRLKAGEEREVQFRVKIPDETLAGGQYANIFVEVLQGEVESEGVTGVIKMDSRVAVKLHGSAESKAERVVKVGAPWISGSGTGREIVAGVGVENTGNIDFNAVANFSVQTVLGKRLYADESVVGVLPGGEKSLMASWGEAPVAGVYKVFYGVKAVDTEVSAQRVVVLCSPGVAILIVGLTIFCVIFGIIKVWRK